MERKVLFLHSHILVSYQNGGINCKEYSTVSVHFPDCKLRELIDKLNQASIVQTLNYKLRVYYIHIGNSLKNIFYNRHIDVYKTRKHVLHTLSS